MSSFFRKFINHLRDFFRSKEAMPPTITGRKTEPLRPTSDLDSPTRRQLSHPATPLGINLGIDFGTKFTKVCFRDIARNASSVISFAGLTVTQPEDAMLPSRLCIDDESNVTSGLTTSEWRRHDDPRTHSKCVPVDYIKMRLAQLDFPPEEGAWRPAPMTHLKAEADIEALSAFYIACVIDRSRKWIAQRHAKLLLGRRVEWSACLGVPVEYCDSPALDRFKRVLKMAWFWLEEGVPLKMPLGEIRETATSLREKAEKERADCFVLPEIAAAVQSFIASPEATEGIYTYFDIGSATLDGVMFRYYKPEGRPSLNFYTGHVRPLGVSAISEQLVRNSGSPLAWISTGNYLPKFTTDLRGHCRWSDATVVHPTMGL